MAARGGRRQHTWSAPVSWPEASVLDAARAVASARQGPLSRADWLLALAEPVLHEAADDTSLSAHLRNRAQQALAQLQAERTQLAAHPPRLGRPPQA